MTSLARTATFALTIAASLAPASLHADEAVAVSNFTLKNLQGESISLHESLARGPVLVAFWATWCKPCLQELPEISERAASWSEQGLTTFAISIDKPRSHSRVRSLVRSKSFDFEVLLDPNQEAFRKLQGQTVPYLVLLDASGEAVYTKVGYRPGDENALAEEVATFLSPDGASDTDAGEATMSTEAGR